MHTRSIFQKLGVGLLSAVLPLTVHAEGSFGDLANNLMGPTEIVTKLVLLACYIIGAILIFVAIAQYKIHRQNPKLVPLTTPIALLILGVVAILVPYGSHMFGETASAVDQNRAEGRSLRENLLPVPNTAPRGPSLPRPARPAENTPTPPPPSQTNDYNLPPPSSSHWTDDPQYTQP